MSGDGRDRLVRVAAFQFLDEQSRIWGDVLPWRVLAARFELNGHRVPLVSQQGIFKPAVLREVALSIRTTPIIEGRDRPYDDGMTADGLLMYRYRGTDPSHSDNAGLRQAMAEQTPLVHFQGITKGHHLASWPVFIVGDDPAALAFTVAVAEPQALAPDLSPAWISNTSPGRGATRSSIEASTRADQLRRWPRPASFSVTS